MSINGHDQEDGALPPDPRLRAALGHAPDHAQRPPTALRDKVLRAAHAAAPQPPHRSRFRDTPWWQRLFAPGPGALAAVAGVATAGLAINLAWRLSNEPAEAPVAAAPAPTVVAEMRAPASEAAASGRAGLAQAPPMRAEPSPPMSAPTLKRALPAPAAPAPRQAPRSADAVATAEAPTANPSTAGSVQAEREAVADARVERARSLEARQAPPAAAPTTAAPTAAAPAPPPAAKAAAARPEAPADSLAAPAPPWPAALGRWAQALAGGGPEQELPAGWQATAAAKPPVAAPGLQRGWWRALLAGTAGRWQATQAAAAPGESTWQVRGPDGAAFTLWLDAETIWLQAGGGTWRAPRPAGLAAAP